MAKSLLDGTEWTATEFAGLPPEDQKAARQELVCLSCDGRAVFRAGQKRQPLFAARHTQDCQLISRPWSAFKFLAETERRTEQVDPRSPMMNKHTSTAASIQLTETRTTIVSPAGVVRRSAVATDIVRQTCSGPGESEEERR